jgi:hypothetical protein
MVATVYHRFDRDWAHLLHDLWTPDPRQASDKPKNVHWNHGVSHLTCWRVHVLQNSHYTGMVGIGHDALGRRFTCWEEEILGMGVAFAITFHLCVHHLFSSQRSTFFCNITSRFRHSRFCRLVLPAKSTKHYVSVVLFFEFCILTPEHTRKRHSWADVDLPQSAENSIGHDYITILYWLLFKNKYLLRAPKKLNILWKKS